MQINFTGRNLQTTDALKNHTEDKFSKITEHFKQITSIDVTFNIDNLKQIAEATVLLPGNEVHASAESEDMYNSIGLLADKLNRQLTKIKEKQKEH